MHKSKKIFALISTAFFLTGCEKPVNPDAETLLALSGCSKEFFKEFCSLGDDGYLTVETETTTTYGDVAYNSGRYDEMRAFYSISGNQIKIDTVEATSILVPDNELEGYLNRISIVTPGEDLVEKFKNLVTSQHLTYTLDNGVHTAHYRNESTIYVDITNKIAPLIEGNIVDLSPKRYLLNSFNLDVFEIFPFELLYELVSGKLDIGCDLTTDYCTVEAFKAFSEDDFKKYPMYSELYDCARYLNLMTIKKHKFSSYFSRKEQDFGGGMWVKQFDYIDYQRKPMSFTWGSGHVECDHSSYQVVSEKSSVDGEIYTFKKCRECGHCFDIDLNIPTN